MTKSEVLALIEECEPKPEILYDRSIPLTDTLADVIARVAYAVYDKIRQKILSAEESDEQSEKPKQYGQRDEIILFVDGEKIKVLPDIYNDWYLIAKIPAANKDCAAFKVTIEPLVRM